jgi:general secretion pathway protein F
MPFFEYRAVDEAGSPACGARRGESADDVRQALLAEGLRATAIGRRDDPGAGGLLRRGVSVEDLAFLHRQTANLLAAGLPLPRALRAVARESRKREFRVLIDAIAADVEAGRALSEALRDHGKVVPPFLADLVKAGEAAGNLPAVLLQVAESGEAEAKMQRSIRTALAYPLVVAAVALAVVILNGTGVLGRFFFTEPSVAVFGGTVRKISSSYPYITTSARSWIDVVDILCSPYVWGSILAVFIVGSLFFFAPLFSFRGAKRRIPVFGRIVREVLVSRFCRVLGLLAARGVPLPAALRLAGTASDSARLEAQAGACAGLIESGAAMDVAAEALQELPATARWGIAAAAARGTIADELAVLARQADERGADRARFFAILLETSLIILIGVFVLFGGGGSILRVFAHFPWPDLR